MTVLLNAQREIADKLLDAQWETKWRQEKVSNFRFIHFRGKNNCDISAIQ